MEGNMRKTGIVIAADVNSFIEMWRLIEIATTVPEVVAIKVGFTLTLRYGLSTVIDAIRDVSKLPVIYDHQKAGTDIPAMGKAFTSTCKDVGVDSLIIFPQAGPKTLEGFVTAATDCEIVPIVGLVMTHQSYLQSEGGYIVDNAPMLICKTAVELGVTSFVLPGTKPDIVKKYSQVLSTAIEPAADILMPGIGSQGGSLNVAITSAAPHRRFVIIGSAIYNAPDPKQALASFAAEIRGVS